MDSAALKVLEHVKWTMTKKEQSLLEVLIGGIRTWDESKKIDAPRALELMNEIMRSTSWSLEPNEKRECESYIRYLRKNSPVVGVAAEEFQSEKEDEGVVDVNLNLDELQNELKKLKDENMMLNYEVNEKRELKALKEVNKQLDMMKGINKEMENLRQVNRELKNLISMTTELRKMNLRNSELNDLRKENEELKEEMKILKLVKANSNGNLELLTVHYAEMNALRMENKNLKEEVSGLKALKDDLERMRLVNLELRKKISDVKQNVVKKSISGKAFQVEKKPAALMDEEVEIEATSPDMESMERLLFF